MTPASSENRRRANDRKRADRAATRTLLDASDDLYLFNEGNHFRLYEKLGAHPPTVRRRRGHVLRGLGAERRARVA